MWLLPGLLTTGYWRSIDEAIQRVRLCWICMSKKKIDVQRCNGIILRSACAVLHEQKSLRRSHVSVCIFFFHAWHKVGYLAAAAAMPSPLTQPYLCHGVQRRNTLFNLSPFVSSAAKRQSDRKISCYYGSRVLICKDINRRPPPVEGLRRGMQSHKTVTNPPVWPTADTPYSACAA